jgi:hypothetical protein
MDWSLSGLITSIIEGLKDFFWWIGSELMELGEYFLDQLINIVPQDALDYVDMTVTAVNSTIVPYLGIVNYWIPLDVASGMLALYLTIQAVTYTTRHVIKFIPFIG